MKGIADGVKDAGINVTLEQILLWNTNYDQWCIYCPPDYWQGENQENNQFANKVENNGGSQQNAIKPAGGGCSSFCAWGEWTGGDGKLIFGKNEDNFNMPEQLPKRILVIASPDDVIGHAFLTYPGMIGLDGGMNTSI